MRLFDRLYELAGTVGDDGDARPVLVRLSSDAKTAWKAYYNAHNIEQADLAGDMTAAWSKLEEYTARLTLVIHFIRWAANDPNLADADICRRDQHEREDCPGEVVQARSPASLRDAGRVRHGTR